MTVSRNEPGASSASGVLRPQLGESISHPTHSRVSARKTVGLKSRLALIRMLAIAIAVAPSTAFAEDKAAETGKQGGLGAAAALSSLIYGPVKLVYATGGLIVGAFA